MEERDLTFQEFQEKKRQYKAAARKLKESATERGDIDASPLIVERNSDDEDYTPANVQEK